MNEGILLKLSLIFSIIGILAILFISENLSLPYTEISDITKENIEDKVKVKGTISKIIKVEGLTIIDLKDSVEEITVIIFEDQENLERNQEIEVLGTVTEYKDKLEVIADEIRII